jgi:hypothetical protein
MEVHFLRLHDGGAFGDVWEAEDALGRRVAVKLIRSAGLALSSALDHARALARAQHPNVVAVYALDTVAHPDTGLPVECVVMEWLDGETLSARITSPRFSHDELLAIGKGLIAGLRHIHQQGLAHGDLHADNVMIVNGVVRIIDILYLDSLAMLSTASRDVRLRRDLLNLRLMLQEILRHSTLDPAEAGDFNASLSSSPSIDEIDAAFTAATDLTRGEDVQTVLARAYSRLVDEGFVAGPAYASAMSAETSDTVVVPLLERLIEERTATNQHKDYIQLLWARVSQLDRVGLLQKLGSAIEQDTPRGKWWALLSILAAIGRDGWTGLSQVVRLRLESQIITDILAGRHDIYGIVLGSPGALGTWARSFWPFFENQNQLTENIGAMLRRDWYSQNYIGKNFMGLLPLLGRTSASRAILIRGLVSAVSNDARVIVAEVAKLPVDWQTEIAEGVTAP